MRSSIRRSLAGLLAILLVSTAAAPVGTAAAQTSENTCSDLEKAAIALSLGYGGVFNDCNNIDTSEDIPDDLAVEDMQTEVYSYATGVEGNREVFADTLDNYLNDTRTIARLEARNAYVDALENNSDMTKAEAKIEAQQAVEEYYATKQRQLINQWQVGTESIRHSVSVINSQNNSATLNDIIDIGVWNGNTYSDSFPDGNKATNALKANADTNPTETVTLVNGDSVTYETITVDDGGYAQNLRINQWAVENGWYRDSLTSAQQEPWAFADIEIMPPDSLEGDNVRMLEQQRYVSQWRQIEDQEQQIANEIGDLVEGTYTEVQNGEIDPQDMIDPYMGAREYDPRNETLGTSWAMRTIMSLGLAPPEDLGSMGNMTVRNETSGENITGMLMSDSAPPQSDGFTVGTTYDATEIPGSQMVAGSDGAHHSLTTNFTLVGATGTNGTEFADGTTIGYGGSITYSATNLSEWKEQMSAATNRTVEITVRRQNLQNGTAGTGGGSGFWPEESPIPGLGGIEAVALFIVAALALIAYAGRDQSGTNIVERNRRN